MMSRIEGSSANVLALKYRRLRMPSNGSIHLQLVLLRTTGDLRELCLRDPSHEPLQATKGFLDLSVQSVNIPQ